MRRSIFRLVALAATTALTAAAQAQSVVAPPSAVQSAPLAAPATPVQATPPVQVEPQPVNPPPTLPGPVMPTPVQPPPPAPAEPQPVAPPPPMPPPIAPPPAAPPPAAPQQQTGAPNANATLAGKPGDASDVDDVVLAAKPVLIVPGQASWDQGFQRLSDSIALLRTEAAKAGLAVAGRPLTLFLQTDDNGFRFEAMLPVEKAPEAGAVLATGVRSGTSPAGRALRFVHVAPYDDIDSTYETITAYLEAKSIVVKDAFLEEYVGDLKDAGDPNLEINVYVQPK